MPDWTTNPEIMALLDGPPASDTEIAAAYHLVCVRCLDLATSIHELVPRSLAKVVGLDPLRWRNRVPLCTDCHTWAQVGPISKALALRAEADKVLSYFA